MKTYTAQFIGRKVGAIGEFHRFTIQVAAQDEQCARLAIYDTHEHISKLKISENKLRARLNKRERKAAQLLKHYATCERLALACGMPAAKVDGKKISVALWKAEKAGQERALALSNNPNYTRDGYGLSERDAKRITALVASALGQVPSGFFVNSDPRGYALKIDNETPDGKALIESVGMHKDWGGYGILSPTIDGD